MIKNCIVCGKEFNNKPHILCCSNKCGATYKSEKAFAKYDIDELKRLYWEEQLSFRQIAKIIKKDSSTVRKVFIRFNIPYRTGSEAIKQQWINNDKRKEQFKKLVTTGDERSQEYKKHIYKNRHIHDKWREKVFKRDGFACVVCKAKPARLHAHHLADIVDFPEHRFNVDNGICVCPKCHCRIHKNIISLDWLPQVHRQFLSL